MYEWSRITIEEYCMAHPKTKKSRILYDLVELSYSMECEPTEEDSINLERIIAREKKSGIVGSIKRFR